MKNKSLKKLISFIMVFIFVFSAVPAVSLMAEEGNGTEEETEETEETSEGTETSPDNQMLHFMMKVRWGNVIGDADDLSETNFDGLVNVSSSARVSLERTLLFERHNTTADKITKRKDPVSWNSLTYGHWDGVKVLVSSPAGDDVTIKTTQGDVTMTAQELYDLSEPKIEDVGGGREIVIKTYPIKNPKYFLKVIWGKTSRADYRIRSKEAGEVEISTATANSTSNAVIANNRRITNGIIWYDASGNFQINNGGTLKFIKTLRFEGRDRITLSNSAEKIEWISHVAQGVDGILTKLNLDANSLNNSDTVTLNFTKVKNSDETEGWSKDFGIIDLYHDRKTIETVKNGYGVILQVWKRPNRSLIRVKGKDKVYMVEDGVKQWIPSKAVLYSNGLSFGNVEEVEQEEADTYGDAEEVCYADGTMVRGKGKMKVYVIANGEKRHIESKEAFELLGYNWDKVVDVPVETLGLYRLGTVMKSNSIHPEGALIREKGTDTVYLIEGGKRKPISTQSIFNARRLNWDKVLVIKKAQMAKFQSGANLQYPDGALVKDPDDKVYKIDHGEKRWIRSGDDLTGAGYSADDIISVTDATEIADLEATVEGGDIFADDVTVL
ncbi:MAG: hypothetical protein U9N04_03325 [Patescibacteria group bacterium]|nr:hypothetical protein [Patescibacteria group bacterium]